MTIHSHLANSFRGWIRTLNTHPKWVPCSLGCRASGNRPAVPEVSILLEKCNDFFVIRHITAAVLVCSHYKLYTRYSFLAVFIDFCWIQVLQSIYWKNIVVHSRLSLRTSKLSIWILLCFLETYSITHNLPIYATQPTWLAEFLGTYLLDVYQWGRCAGHVCYWFHRSDAWYQMRGSWAKPILLKRLLLHNTLRVRKCSPL